MAKSAPPALRLRRRVQICNQDVCLPSCHAGEFVRQSLKVVDVADNEGTEEEIRNVRPERKGETISSDEVPAQRGLCRSPA